MFSNLGLDSCCLYPYLALEHHDSIDRVHTVSYVHVRYTQDQNKQLQAQFCYHKVALLSDVMKHIKRVLER